MSKDVTYDKMYEGPNLDLYYGSDHMLYADWYGRTTTRSVKEGCKAKEQFVEKLQCQQLINDNRRLKGSWTKAVDWIRDEHLPKLKSHGLKQIAHIYSHDKMPNQSINTLLENPLELDIQVFSDLEDALHWLTGKKIDSSKKPNILSIWSNGRAVRMDCEDILFISRFNRKSVIQLKEEEIQTSMSLKQFEEMLPLSMFMRVHKSYIINIKKVKELKYHAGGYYRAYFEDYGKAFVTISKLHSRGLKQALENS